MKNRLFHRYSITVCGSECRYRVILRLSTAVRAFSGKVSKTDIQRQSPYNTYLNKGLPPGPIGNPGRDALQAAMNPAKTDFLYFVARQDGTHQFSRNLTEHNRAVVRYLR